MRTVPFIFPETFEECNQILQKEALEPQKICLAKKKLNGSNASRLSQSIRNAKKLTHFVLIYTHVAPPQLLSLLNGFRNCKTLVHLDLSRDGINDVGAEMISEFLQVNRSLIVVNLAQNDIENEGAEKLSKALTMNNVLSHLLLPGNKFNSQVIEKFLIALKENKSLITLDLGDHTSGRITNALRDVGLKRQVLFESIMNKPNLKKTRFLCAKVNVFGEKNCGKTELLHSLIHGNEGLSEEKEVADVVEYPTVHVTNVVTEDKTEFWELKRPEDKGNYLETNLLKTVALLLRKDRKPRTLRKIKSGKHNSANIADSKSLRSRMTNASNDSLLQSEESMSLDDGFSIDLEDVPVYTPKKVGLTLRKTGLLKKGTLRRTNSNKSFESTKTRNTLATFGSKARKSLRITKQNLAKKSSSFSATLRRKASAISVFSSRSSETSLPKPQRLNGGDNASVPDELTVLEEDSDEDIEDLEEELDLQAYVEANVEDFHALEKLDGEGRGKSAVDRVLDLLKKEYKAKEANSKLKSPSFNDTKKKRKSIKQESWDSNLRNLSKAYKKQETQNVFKTINDQKNKVRRNYSVHSGIDGFSGKISKKTSMRSFESAATSSDKPLVLAKRRTGISRLKRHTIKTLRCSEMKRNFSDQAFVNIKNKILGLELHFWEFSDNDLFDSLYRSVQVNLLPQREQQLNIICFSLYKMSKKPDKVRRTLLKNIQLSKLCPEAKTLIVGTQLDRIKSQKVLGEANTELRRIIKDSGLRTVLTNKSNNLLFFPVDNRKLWGIADLKHKIEGAAKTLPSIKQYIRLKELTLLDLLTSNKTDEEGKLIIAHDYNEVKFWAAKIGIQRADLDDLLVKFHDLGLIFHFRKSRQLSKTIMTKPAWFLDNLCHICNRELLTQTFRILYPHESENRPYNLPKKKKSSMMSEESVESDPLHFSDPELCSVVSESEEEKEVFFVTEKMISYILNDCRKSDVKVIIGLMKQMNLACTWQYEDDLDLLPNLRLDDDEELLLIPNLINPREVVIDHSNMFRDARKRIEADVVSPDDAFADLYGDFVDELVYQVFLEVGGDDLYPSGFTATLFSCLIQFLENFEKRLNNGTPKSNKAYHKVSAQLRKLPVSGLILLEINIADTFCFFLQPEVHGISFFVSEAYKKGALGSYLLFDSLMKKVNKEILKVDIKFEKRIGKTGKLINLKRILAKNKKLTRKAIFNRLFGVEMYDVKSLNDIEKFL